MNKRILKLAIPSILANITVPLVGMVDIAISGRLGNVAAIGAIAIGSMLFDLLYWNFGFLRIGTGGLTAQAYGRRDLSDAMKYLVKGLATAFVSALFLIAIQWFFVEAAFMVIDCTPELETLSRQYFFIRIWAAPATLALFTFKGWFIGMQNTVSPMAVDIVVNVVNIAASAILAITTPLGFAGIALGTVIAQYSGLFLSLFLLKRYYGKFIKYINLRRDIHLRGMKKFYVINANLFVRSLFFMLIYCGFTSLMAHYGETELAVSSIIMKLFMLYSYILDGFAYAGEALSGRYIGANDGKSLREAVRKLFMWTGVLAAVSTVIYWCGGDWMIRMMTSEQSVIEGSGPYYIWLVLMPSLSCLAFMWDGLYIGATASVAIRNCMGWACLGFYIAYFALKGQLGPQALYIAYFVHLIIRAFYMTLFSKKNIFSMVGNV